MSAAARSVAVRPAAPASSTAPRAVPPGKPVTISPETLARIEAVLVADRGETVAAFVARAVLHELGCREGARAFRKALGLDVPPAAPGPVKAGCANGCTDACAEAAEGREESFT